MIHLLLRDKAMTTQEIKAMDSKCLNEYLCTLPATDHRFFVSAVVEACGNGIKRKTFYNWKAGCCCIPSFRKAEIEKIAGRVVFPRELYVTDADVQAAQPRQTGRMPENPDTGTSGR
ncbi:hypothetical protein [uncultured Duncaniella sp.]|nr:hypothetical protein [uncultured Duncaniella sp.]